MTLLQTLPRRLMRLTLGCQGRIGQARRRCNIGVYQRECLFEHVLNINALRR
jgi:hypothetical protein